MQLQKNNLQNVICGNCPQSQEVSIAEYQKSVAVIYKNAPGLPESQSERGRFLGMGLVKEIGQLSTSFGKSLINYETLENNKVEKQLKGCLWYLTAISDNYGLDLETIARKNIEKAKARYNKNGIAQIPSKGDGR